MSRVHRLKSLQFIPAPLDKVWDFFSSPDNLLSITPPFLSLKVTNEVFGKNAYPGQVITYTVRPFLSIPVFWMTEITHVEDRKYFVDEQRKGPYRLWHHQHHFEKREDGVLMTDIVHYRLPFGFIGDLFHPLLVKKKLQQIFLYRYARVVEEFGGSEGHAPFLEIE
jgi:ligand-binding SRPBCC domain-containing protein